MTRPSQGEPDSPRPFGQWIADARAGSEEAWARLFEACRGYLLAVADKELRPALASKLDPADLVQETFLKAHQSLAGFQGESEADLLAWLRSVLVNHLANLNRQFRDTGKRDVARETALSDLFEGQEPALVDPADTPRSRALAEERSRALHAALGRLPEDYRRVVHWRHWEGLSFPEIGRRLGRSAEACRKLWGRAVEQLHRYLEPGNEP